MDWNPILNVFARSIGFRSTISFQQLSILDGEEYHMNDTSDIIEEMRAREHHQTNKLSSEHIQNNHQQTYKKYRDDDVLDDLWFDLWKVL